MIRCRVIEQFTLKDFDKLSNIKRKSIEEKCKLFVGDEFDCDEEMAKYLTGGNEKKKVVVKVIEVLPKDISPKDTKAESEEIIPLTDSKELEKLGNEILAHIKYHDEQLEPKVEFKPKKKKSKK